MRIINSYDLFDIILGRKINNKIDFFNKCMSNNKLLDFVNVRIISEQKAQVDNMYYNLFHIYKYIQEYYKLSYAKTIEYLGIEIQSEIDNIYPIYNNINKLNADSIITIEHYYNSEQIKKFLSKYNIIDLPIYTSNELNTLKSDGTIYNYLKKFYKIKLHTGANYTLDYEVPNSLKIKSSFYEYTYNPIIVNIQNKLSEKTLEYFKMIELGCINDSEKNVWNLQLYYNIPTLIVFCNSVYTFCIENNIKNVIFLSRSGSNLRKLFNTFINMKNNYIITSEIAISFKLLGNKKYLKNLLTNFNNTDKYLFVDFNDCFTFYLNNILKVGFNNEPYFYNMFNNRFTSTNLINANSFFVNDFESTKVIELMNLPSEGAPIDYNDSNDTNSSGVIYDKLEFNQNLVNIHMRMIDLIIKTYEADIFNDIALNFVNTVVDNLTKIKLVINSLPEYNDLKKIFNTVGDECIKVDYHDPNIVNNLDKSGQRNEYLRVIKK